MEKSKFKKIILILSFILIIILVAGLIWKTFFKEIISPNDETKKELIDSKTGLPLSPDGSGNEGVNKNEQSDNTSIIPSPDVQTSPQLPTKPKEEQISSMAIGGLTETTTIVPDSTLKATLSSDGNSVQFYNKSDGKFYIVNEDGDIIPLSNKVFHNVEKIEWAPNKSKAVLEYPDNSKIIYDFSKEKQITLPKHWEDFSFSPDSNKLVNKSLGLDPDNRWLIVSNSDGSQTRALEFIGQNDKNVIPSWSPNNQMVGMYTKGVDFDRRELLFIGQDGENFKSTIIEGWGFEGEWSQKGDKMLYSVYSPKDDLKPRLWVVNSNVNDIGVNRRNLELETWANKCTFANNDEVYCAVPRSLEKGAGMYPELALKTSDDLYKINLRTGQKELIAIPEYDYNISSISVSKDQKTLFFTDHRNGQIHKIKLP